MTDRPNPNVTEEIANSNQHNIRLAPDDKTPPLSPSLLIEDALPLSAARPTGAEIGASTKQAALQPTYSIGDSNSIVSPSISNSLCSRLSH